MKSRKVTTIHSNLSTKSFALKCVMLKMFLNSPIGFKILIIILILGITPAVLFITTVIPDKVLGLGIYDCQAHICVLNPWTDWGK